MQGNTSITYNPELKKLTVRNASEFPESILEYAQEVEILDMAYGTLTTLPTSIQQFTEMRVAFFSYNEFQTIPASLTSCPQLKLVGFKSCKIATVSDHAFPEQIKGIILTDNKITSLPASIGTYASLKKLMLTGNYIANLPKELLNCRDLELIRLSVNKLSAFPTWLTELPKLSWYADAGNPYQSNERHEQAHPPLIDWQDIELGEKIGVSASNEVYQAMYKNQKVAVKLYGAELSTDGLASDDMMACLLAGSHSQIIGAIGQLKNTPGNKPGLVMPMIAAAYRKLGNPPDFATYTRDVYTPTQKYSTSVIVQIAKDIASAMEYCHQRGIMHGDLYAHNILTNEEGQSYLGDFGAASIYTPQTPDGVLREKLDVRAYGRLLEELCQNTSDEAVSEDIKKVMKQCLNDTITAIPTFQEIKTYFS